MHVSLQTGASSIRTAGQVVTRDPNVGNGIKFTSLTDEDRETLRQFVASVVAQQKGGSAS